MDAVEAKIEEVVSKVTEMKKLGKFLNYIEYMVFPYFKNLSPNTRIDLTFPMIVLIGKNGSGKTSTLHAFYGAPRGHSCGEFWFSTNVDPIVETGEDTRNRFFYGYKEKNDDEIKEVRISRIKRSASDKKKEDPDYWETTRPAKQDGMKETSDMSKRNSPVQKDVIYIDFRGELSAFDKCFYFIELDREKRQNFLRRRSIYLERKFNSEELHYPPESKGKKVSESLIIMNEKCINKINEILGKSYTEIKMVRHKLYGKWGISVLVKNKLKAKYSEANAGSGEIAIIKLVHEIMNAKPYSLILLDEPEISLHPSAQVKLKLFLLEQIQERKHQVIISSHSPALIQNMPDEALKLFETGLDGKFIVKNEVNFREAFYNIEDSVLDKKTIVCEDESAKCLINKILKKLEKSQYFNVIFIPGGADTILKKYLPAISQKELSLDHIFIILDGDKNQGKKYSIEELTKSQLESVVTLENYVKEVIGYDIPTYEDGNKGHGRQDQKAEILGQYLNFHNNNIFYLPDEIPEILILESMYAQQNYTNILKKYNPINNMNAKEVIADITYELHGDKSKKYIDSTISMLANKWVYEDGENQNYIEVILNNIFSRR